MKNIDVIEILIITFVCAFIINNVIIPFLKEFFKIK